MGGRNNNDINNIKGKDATATFPHLKSYITFLLDNNFQDLLINDNLERACNEAKTLVENFIRKS